MKSGVYLLTFSNGATYVGKTIDFERRWREHFDKMQRGKAAKNMQEAYDRYGLPRPSVLVECHCDHIDLMETYYICKLHPSLNSVGGVNVSSKELEILESNPELLKQSTPWHLNKIRELFYYKKKFLERDDDYKKVIEEVGRRVTYPTDVLTLQEMLENAEAECEVWKNDYNEILDERNRLKKMSLWRRIFNWK